MFNLFHNIKEFIKEARVASDTKKKVIIVVVVIISALILGFFWVKSAMYNFSKIGQSLQSINLPTIDVPQDAINSLSDIKNKVSDAGKTVADMNSQAADESAKALATADWKTYTNSEYGFEFQYPKEVIVKENKNMVGIYYTITESNKEQLESENFGWDVLVYQNNSKKDLKDWFNLMFNKKDVDGNCVANVFESNINIRGADTIVFGTGEGLDSSKKCNDGGYYTISPDKLTVIKWELFQDPEYFDQIFPTFKFTK